MPAMYDELAKWLEKHDGIEPRLLQHHAFRLLVDSRVKQLQLGGESEYLARIRQDRSEHERLLAEISVPETWFFRYPASFDYLYRVLLRRRQESPPNVALEMLSIGCATGEEPISLAITARAAGWPSEQLRVTAIDRNSVALSQRQDHRFGRRSIREPIPTWAMAYLREDPNSQTVQVAESIMACITFRQANVLADGEYDGARHRPFVIACRNLLIYLNTTAQRQVARFLRKTLPNDGLLMVGHADPSGVLNEYFQPVTAASAYSWNTRPNATGPPVVQSTQAKAVTSVAPPDAPMRSPSPGPPTRAPRHDTQASPQVLPSESILESDDIRKLAGRGELELAYAACRARLAASADCPQTLSLLGSIQLGLGQLEAATESFRKSLYLDPNHEDSLLQMSLILRKAGRAEEADRYARRAAIRHTISSREPGTS